MCKLFIHQIAQSFTICLGFEGANITLTILHLLNSKKVFHNNSKIMSDVRGTLTFFQK